MLTHINTFTHDLALRDHPYLSSNAIITRYSLLLYPDIRRIFFLKGEQPENPEKNYSLLLIMSDGSSTIVFFSSDSKTNLIVVNIMKKLVYEIDALS